MLFTYCYWLSLYLLTLSLVISYIF